ncbi:MAG TPA: adenylate kinase [Candidatus Limnocylindria bacterium]
MTEPGAAQPAPDGRLILLLIGAVGAGKGTQAERLEDRLGIPHLASGDLFRAALRDGTSLGERARAYMDRGDLVPDDITIAMFMERLSQADAARGAILDGFPRTVGQAAALDATLAERGERIARAIYIAVPTEDLIARVAGRSVCPVCGTPYHDVTDPPRQPGICDKDGTRLVRRDDDAAEVVRARLEKQVPPMLEVVAHYRDGGVLTEVDGRRPIDEVLAEILGALP